MGGVRKMDLPLELVAYARMGDAILDRIIYDFLKNHKFFGKTGKNGKMDHTLFSTFTCNDFISRYEYPMRFKGNIPYKKSVPVKGDMAEAYVAFLYVNYGYDTAKRYVVKQTLTIIANY